jgi:hypothetical protein
VSVYPAPVTTMTRQGKDDRHRQVARELERRKYHERVKSGLCHKCGCKRGKKRADRTTCQDCGEKESARLTALYYRRRAEQ